MSIAPVVSEADLCEVPFLPAPVEPSSEKQSYHQILRSSLLVGGSSAINVLIGVLRAKAMAVLLGPSGVGLAGLYTSIIDLTQSAVGLGINSSGVRQIAEANGSGDLQKIAATAAVLRRTSLCLGLLGAALLLLSSRLVSQLSFGDAAHSLAVCALASAVFFRLISAGQGALIQGMRRISDLAQTSVFGAAAGTATSLLLVYFFREAGIVPSLIAVAVTAALVSWWYSRKIRFPAISLQNLHTGREASALLKLGVAFMVSSLMTMGSGYIIRIIVLRDAGFEAAGFYQSAWTLGGLYVAFILQAMGADFYPRLTACCHDHDATNRLVNQQARVGLLLAVPGLLATLTFAPVIISLFYSPKFHAAVEILRWICLGAVVQVIAWPMGFIILGKGRQDWFLGSEISCTAVYVVLAYFLIRTFGVNGAGMAFFGFCLFHAVLTYPIVRRLSGFRWSRENAASGLLLLCVVAAVFAAAYLLPPNWRIVLGAGATLVCGVYSARVLSGLLAPESIPAPLRSLLRRWPARRPSLPKGNQ